MFLVITIVLIGAAFVAFWQKGSRAWLRYVLLVGAVIVINLTSLDFGLSLITGSGVDDSVFYHLKTGLSGGDVSQYSTIVIALCAVSVFLGSGLFLLLRNLQMMAQVHDVRWNGAIIGLVATAVLFHPVSVATMKYLFRFSLAEQKQGGYHIPVASSRPDRAQNLVLVYLEGLEQTYFDAGKFPNLVPELTAIRDRGVSFSDVGQTIGAGFTIGGMVAGQCGVPDV